MTVTLYGSILLFPRAPARRLVDGFRARLRLPAILFIDP
jgi:hypothetical protein